MQCGELFQKCGYVVIAIPYEPIMRNQLKTITYIVNETLEENPMTRGNDIYLAIVVLTKMGMSTDLKDIRKQWDGNVLSSIWRARRKLQEQFEHLRPCEDVLEQREENRKGYVEWAREV